MYCMYCVRDQPVLRQFFSDGNISSSLIDSLSTTASSLAVGCLMVNPCRKLIQLRAMLFASCCLMVSSSFLCQLAVVSMSTSILVI